MPSAEPITMRRSSTAGTLVRIPTPLRNEMHPLTGSYKRNISRLEQSAEEMSASGSDLGEEIRRIASAGSRRSRENSIQSSRDGDISVVRPGVVERYGYGRGSGSGGRPSRRSSAGGSRSRYVSPGAGYVGSPIGSVHAGLQRDASTRSLRLPEVSETTQEGRSFNSSRQHLQHEEQDEGGVSRQVSSTSFGRRYDEIAGHIRDSLVEMGPSSQVYHNEGARRQFEHPIIEGTETPPDRPRSTDTYREAQIAFQDFDGVHYSPDKDDIMDIDEHGNEVRRVSDRASGAFSVQAASVLRARQPRAISYAEPPPGEDMVYYPAPVPRMLNLPKRLSQLPAASVQAQRRSQMLAELPPEARAAAPWLAPIKNRSQERLAGTHSRGASSGSHGSQGTLHQRASGNFNKLAPQLRSGAFFDHPSVEHDVQVQGQSAVATLESILAASATAPVTAFTDHPYAGDVRKDVYSAEHKKAQNSSSTVALSPARKSDKKRSSSIGVFFKRNQSTDELEKKSDRRNSRASMLTDLGADGRNKLKKRRSVLSFGDELDREQAQEQPEREDAQTPEFDNAAGLIGGAQNVNLPDSPTEKRESLAPTVAFDDGDGNRRDDDDGEVLDVADEEEGEPTFVQPSTLLAELQVRKAQLKSRNRTAATAFPTGMHSTLLQLDAVEEINKRKRQRQRIALAWEDPHQRALDEEGAEADEDVPLGVLFPSKEGRTARKIGDGKDWDRPLGLMERREMEDNEPLSSRRNRLQGNDTARGRPPSPHRRPGTGLGLNTPQLRQGAQTDVIEKAGDEAKAEGEDSEHEGETLGQRMRRMRAKEALDGTIAHIEAKDKEGSDKHKSGFTEEWASQFGNLDVAKNDEANVGAERPSPAISQGENEEETLGQRRARLQREAAAAGGSRNTSGGSAPLLRSSASLANLLAANPTGNRPTANPRAHTAATGTLLHISGQQQARTKSQLQNTNMRSSSYALGKPLVDTKTRATEESRGMLANEGMQSRAPAGGFGGGMYSNGAGGAKFGAINGYQGMNTNMGMGGMPMVNTPGGNSFFASPTAGYFGGGYGAPSMMQQQMGYPQQLMQMGGWGYPQQQQQQQYNLYDQPMMSPSTQWKQSGNATMPGMMGGTYASFAQTGHLPGEEGFMGDGNGGAGAAGTAVGGEGGPHHRSAIERWRMAVAGQ